MSKFLPNSNRHLLRMCSCAAFCVIGLLGSVLLGQSDLTQPIEDEGFTFLGQIPIVADAIEDEIDVLTESSDFGSEAELIKDSRGFELLPKKRQNDENFSLRVAGRLQVRYTYFDDIGPFDNPSANEFELERIRLVARGFAFDRDLTYRISSDWDSDGRNNAGLTSAFVQLDLQSAVGFGRGDSTYLKMGLWRSPFGRQRAASSRGLQFVDRSMASTFFGIGRNVGAALKGKFSHRYRPVNYEIGIINGLDAGRNSPRTGLDNNLGVVVHVNETLFGKYEESESDLGLSSHPSMRIGSSFAFTRRTRRGATGSRSEFDADPGVLMLTDVANGDASFGMDDLSGSEQDYDLMLAGVELDWKHCGWSFHTEYLLRSIYNVRFNGPEIFGDFSQGYYAQGGYFLTEKVEIVARHSGIHSSGHGSGAPTGNDYRTSAHATGGGLNFYFRGNNSKLQLDAFYYDGAPSSSSSLGVIAGDNGVMFRMQYQLSF